MKIAHLEIANFRKLLSVRIDLSGTTTLLVGANNSGKTSAITVLRLFLKSPDNFVLNDFTLSQWARIREIGALWSASDGSSVPTLADWGELVPSLDLWFAVASTEYQYVSKLVPDFEWDGGLLGVRLRYEPKDIDALRDDYISNIRRIEEVKSNADPTALGAANAKLWPGDLIEFLDRRLSKHFTVAAYLLDPAGLVDPDNGQARPQVLTQDLLIPGDVELVRSLMQVDDIDAQRGFGQGGDPASVDGPGGRGKLSAQLRRYFDKHLDPTDSPDASDLAALKAIEDAQGVFDERLTEYFRSAIAEVQGLGYPGVSDPRIELSTRLRPVDGLKHEAAVRYQVDITEDSNEKLHLPEEFNGLGYQNLISMIFRLMSFRDAWMKVGKASSGSGSHSGKAPLHLVLVEEPEAHLHAQVQQVFAKKAYHILRRHDLLGEGTAFATQLLISTHSIHIAHELEFSCIRYFRRLPAGQVARIPVSSVINLTETFGNQDENRRFVSRYLKTQHCDLFFADAAILVEGSAERILVPHFIKRSFPFLNQCYITMLEVGGSHAHRLRNLVNHLGLTKLIITDLDSRIPAGARSPRRNEGQISGNPTLQTWVPAMRLVDDLLDLDSQAKTCDDDDHMFAVRVAFQTPLNIQHNGATGEAIPYTFEDSLLFENYDLFSALDGEGMVAAFRTAISEAASIEELSDKAFAAVRKGDKARFAMDLMFSDQFQQLRAPHYISEGLAWLEDRLRKRQSEILAPTDAPSEIANI